MKETLRPETEVGAMAGIEMAELRGPSTPVILVALGLGFVAVIAIYPQLTWDVLRFLVFLGFFVVVPAVSLGTLLVRPRVPASLGFLLGLVPATAVLVLLGLAELVFRVHYLTALSPVLALVTLVLRRNKINWRSVRTDRSLSVSLIGIYLIAVGFLVWTLLIPSAPPTAISPGLYYQDSLWTVGNTQSLDRSGLPLHDLRMAGLTTGYHIAQNIFQVVAIRWTGIYVFYLHFFIEPVWDWFVLCSSVVAGVWMWVSRRVSVLILGSALLLFSSDVRGVFNGSPWNTLTYFYSLAPFVVFFLAAASPLARGQGLPVAYLLLCFLLAASSKGTLLVLIPLIFGSILVLRLVVLRRRPGHAEWGVVVGMFLVGALLRYTIFNSPNLGHGIVVRAISMQQVAGSGTVLGFGIRALVSHLWHGFVDYPMGVAAVLLVLAWGLRRVSFGFEWFSLLLAACVSLVVGSQVLFVGGEEYFFWYSAMLMGMGLIFYLRSVSQKFVLPASLLVGFAVLVGFGFFLAAQFRHHLLWGSFPGQDRLMWDSRASIDLGEWQGCLWARENLDRGAVFATNRRGFRHERTGDEVQRFFGFTALTGMQAYVEGDAFIPPSSRQEAAERWRRIQAFLEAPSEESLASLPISYLFLSRRFSDRALQLPSLKLRFENESLRIYEKAP